MKSKKNIEEESNMIADDITNCRMTVDTLFHRETAP
jgi:hypothetical protein